MNGWTITHVRTNYISKAMWWQNNEWILISSHGCTWNAFVNSRPIQISHWLSLQQVVSSTSSSMKEFRHACTYFALINSRSLQWSQAINKFLTTLAFSKFFFRNAFCETPFLSFPSIHVKIIGGHMTSCHQEIRYRLRSPTHWIQWLPCNFRTNLTTGVIARSLCTNHNY